MGYSADQAKSVEKSTLILIPYVFPLPPRTIASVRRVCFLLVLLLTPNARRLDQWLGRIKKHELRISSDGEIPRPKDPAKR